jgi:hypothetical protein
VLAYAPGSERLTARVSSGLRGLVTPTVTDIQLQ